jgi:hypothetical protein
MCSYLAVECSISVTSVSESRQGFVGVVVSIAKTVRIGSVGSSETLSVSQSIAVSETDSVSVESSPVSSSSIKTITKTNAGGSRKITLLFGRACGSSNHSNDDSEDSKGSLENKCEVQVSEDE